MTILADPISTTDLRVWVEGESAPEYDCIFKDGREAVARFWFSCGCIHEVCVSHRDMILEKTKIRNVWDCLLCEGGMLVFMTRWEPIR